MPYASRVKKPESSTGIKVKLTVSASVTGVQAKWQGCQQDPKCLSLSLELLCLWNRDGHAECLESLPSKALPLLQETSTLGPYQLTLLPGATTTNKLQKS